MSLFGMASSQTVNQLPGLQQSFGAVLSNSVCGRRIVQDLVHSLGGAELLLIQCQVWCFNACHICHPELPTM